MNGPRIVFGLGQFPRPCGMGYLYYKYPGRFSVFTERTLVALDLHNTDEKYLRQMFQKALEKLPAQHDFLRRGSYGLLSACATENMKDFADQIFHDVIEQYLSRKAETESPIPVKSIAG
ncbi:MAG: hypothetical protein JW884_08835 [Deltaproteobacteria bacterium]|nr:hypothetical protein [Deltaproteobacteria bacterium]